jgi:hypothetical protein
VGVGLDTIYVLVGGLTLTRLFQSETSAHTRSIVFVMHPREAALSALLLIGVIPTLLAFVVHAQAVFRDAPNWLGRGQRLRRVAHNTYRTTPTAWDYIARKRGDWRRATWGCCARSRGTWWREVQGDLVAAAKAYQVAIDSGHADAAPAAAAGLERLCQEG